MAKRVLRKPEWMASSGVMDIYSVSPCLCENFGNNIPHWRHNGYWLFDSVTAIKDLSREHSIGLEGTRFFYYEIHPFEYDEDEGVWEPFGPASLKTEVMPPEACGKRLEGYDVVSYSAGQAPECSPLSCNDLAKEMRVNEHCLFPSFEEAKSALENGLFKNAEPGPYRIFAVYLLTEAFLP